MKLQVGNIVFKYSLCYHNNIAGQLVSSDECPYIWLGDICDTSLNVPKSSVTPQIHQPLSDNYEPLLNLCVSLKNILGCNFLHGLGVIAGLIIGIGYDHIVKEFSCCPSIIVTGNLGRGKTTALSAVMSLIGCQQVGELVKYIVSANSLKPFSPDAL